MKLRKLLSIFGGLVITALLAMPAVRAQELPFPAPSSEAPAEAQALVNAGRFAEAEEALRSYLRQNDRSAAAHALLAYALLRENKPRESLEEYTRAAAIEKPSAQTLERVGQDYVLLEDWADADAWTLRAVRMDPSNADAWYSLGRIRYTEQRFHDALSCFQHVLKLSPGNAKVENNIGLTYEALDQTDPAVEAYRQAIAWQNELPPAQRSEQPLLNLGIVLLHRGELAEAETLLTQAVAIAPKDPRILEQLGHLFMQKADYPAALGNFQQACAMDPKNAGLHFLLGQVYRRLGRLQEAKDEFALAVRLGDASRR